MTRLEIVRRGLKEMHPSKRVRGMQWLADALKCSRQALYQVLNLEERSADLEAELSRLFPALPPWPQENAGRLIPLEVWLTQRAGLGRRTSSS